MISRRGVSRLLFCSSAINYIDEDVYLYPSPIFSDQNEVKNSILALIWSQKKRWDHSCLHSIRNLLQLILSSPRVHKYIHTLPPPTYQYRSFLHWIEIYVHSSKLNTISSAKKDFLYSENLLLLSKIPILDEVTQYIIGDTTDENILEFLEKDEVVLTLTQFRTKYGTSRADGKLNASLPELKLYFDKPFESRDLKKNSDTQTETTLGKIGVANKSSEVNSNKAEAGTETEDKSTDLEGRSAEFGAGVESFPEAEPEAREEAKDEAITAQQVYIEEPPQLIEVSEAEVLASAVLGEESESVIRFEIANNRTEAVRIELEFEAIEGNYYCPCVIVAIQVQPMAVQNLITLMKKDPSLPWGDMQYVWRIEKPKQSSVKESTTEVYSENIDLFGLDEIGMNVSDFDDEIAPPTGKVSCPRCTLFNEASDLKCSVCNYVFTKNNR